MSWGKSFRNALARGEDTGMRHFWVTEREQRYIKSLEALVEMAYNHMDTYGVVSGGNPLEYASQDAFFDAYHKHKKIEVVD